MIIFAVHFDNYFISVNISCPCTYVISMTTPGKPTTEQTDAESAVLWLEAALPRIMRRLMDADDLDMPLLQLPLAQMRLAQALYPQSESPTQPQLNQMSIDKTNRIYENEPELIGQTMSRLSERLGVRHNALTQAADRLVNHRLAERHSDPIDRRIVRLRLTNLGMEWVCARRARRHAHLLRLWSLLDSEERSSFLRSVRVLESAADRLGSSIAEDKATDKTIEATTGMPTELDTQTVEEILSRFTAGTEQGGR